VLGEFLQQPRVAYFSMEIALRNEIPTYAGGLGILAVGRCNPFDILPRLKATGFLWRLQAALICS
jgi:hypothetical protein